MNDGNYPIEIMLSPKKLNKLRNFVFEFVGLCVLALALFLVLMSWAEKAVGDGDSWFSWIGDNWGTMICVTCVFLIPVIGIAWFVLGRINKMRRYIPGLVIDADGLEDRFAVIADKKPRRIRREDITGVEVLWGQEGFVGTHYIAPQNLIVLKVKNPRDYIRRQSGIIKRAAMRGNLKMHGSPFLFNDDILNIRFKDLVILMEREFGYLPDNAD